MSDNLISLKKDNQGTISLKTINQQSVDNSQQDTISLNTDNNQNTISLKQNDQVTPTNSMQEYIQQQGIPGSTILDMEKGAIRGIGKAILNTTGAGAKLVETLGNAPGIKQLSDFMNQHFPLGYLYVNNNGDIKYTTDQNVAKNSTMPLSERYRSWANNLGDANTVPGNITETISQFTGPQMVWSKGLQAAGMASSAANYVAGMISNVTAFDPNNPDLSNYVEKLPIPILNKVAGFLATDKNDPEWLNSVKTAAEGAGLGHAVDKFLSFLSHYKMSVKASNNIVQAEHGVVKMTPVASTEDANKSFHLVNNLFDQSRIAQEQLVHKQSKTLYQMLNEKIVDAKGNMKDQIIKNFGPEGQTAILRYEAIQGSTAKSQRIFQGYKDEIYKGLNDESIKTLDNLITANRFIQIGAYKKDYQFMGKGDKAIDYVHWKDELQKQIGAQAFSDLENRSNKYFGAMREQLQNLRDNNIINDSEFKKLVKFDYSPIEFIKKIDPEQDIYVGGKKISVSSSGISQLKTGGAGAVELETKTLLEQVIARTQGRIMKNNANQALYDLAKANPENSLIIIPKEPKVKTTHEQVGLNVVKKKTTIKTKIPKGYQRIDVRIDGKTQPMFMDEHMAELWSTSNPVMSRDMANMLRAVSGSSLIKPLATGYNPEFAIKNFSRDLFHTYLSVGEYSNHLPVFIGQFGNDLKDVAHDAITRTGRYNDYINEGGGMSFLTHQGRDIYLAKPKGTLQDLNKQLDPKFGALKEIGGYLGETSEIMTRLAIRERYIKSGFNPQDATLYARRYMDFSQGGSWSKGIDNFVPYFNAAIQGTRGVVRLAKENPKAFAARAAWLAAFTGGLSLANWQVNSEGYGQVPDRIKVNDWVMMLPDNFSFTDNDGYKRYAYITFPKDQTAIMLTAPAEMAMIKSQLGRNPTDGAFSALKNSLTILPTNVPSYDFYSALANNTNTWNNEPIWKGDPSIPDPLKYYGLRPGGGPPTPDIYQFIGEETGLPPEQLHVGVNKLLPQNMFTDALGYPVAAMSKDISDYDKTRTFQELLVKKPILRTFIRLTHPEQNFREISNEEAAQANRPDIIAKNNLDNLLFKLSYNELKGGRKTVETYIKAQQPMFRDMLLKRYEIYYAIEKLNQRFKGTEISQHKRWWLHAATLSPEVRAEIYYNRWRDADAQGRKQLEQYSIGLNNIGTGFRSDRFSLKLMKLKKEWGDK